VILVLGTLHMVNLDEIEVDASRMRKTLTFKCNAREVT
jgi:hypothetical protein